MGRKGKKNKRKSRRRRILLLVLIGLGVAAAKAAQDRAAAPAPLRVVPTPPAPPAPPAPAAKKPAPAAKDVVSEPAPVEQLETEAPVAAIDPADTAVMHDPVVSEVIGGDAEDAHAHLGDVPPAPADSLTSFFEEVLTESKAEAAPKPRRRAKTEAEPKES